ncbi:anaerobic ribonucleoside-triphosphate reductase [uncultured Phascolarctobacterium sp.]|uniref:anaerobic ribonucleoside-triphosphate reductase n=1 Tax=uncultured Phascolarctobacterium sp. TaxID=512296 RepID=UPI0025F23E61|nr:anaerobic ribonucleoside-triphosphate reductase [uncultured Phascolarctobacterium sp.]
MKIKKRDGSLVDFNKDKIINAISKAGFVASKTKNAIADVVEKMAKKETLTVEKIQDIVETELMLNYYPEVAREYVRYRYKRELIRNTKGALSEVLEIVNLSNQDVNEENSNKNPVILSTQRDYMAGMVSKELSEKLLFPPDVMKAHKAGIIHVHDMDYAIQKMYNCALLDMEDMLQNGTVINGTMIEKAHSFATACNIATQIMAQVASNQYGGQSVSVAHLAPFVNTSRQKIKEEVKQELDDIQAEYYEMDLDYITEKRLKAEITKGVQTMQYQINTLMTSNGQTPFVTLFLYLNEAKNEQEKKDLAMVIEEIIRQRYQGVKNEKGAWITAAFPKLIYVLEEDNIRKGTPYYYLTEMCAKCTAKRMQPDYLSEKIMLKNKKTEDGVGHCYPPMGCRSFLTPYLDENGKAKFYGRFNQGVVSINLVDVALSAAKDKNKFWSILDERLELCHKALRVRHQNLKGTISNVSPIHWQYGAIARLQKGEKIDKLLENGYSTISLGYAGLYECCMAMFGKSHTDPAVKPFALSVMQHLNDKCAEWKAKEHLGYSVYGTPMETTTYKFAKCLRDRFGVIKEVTDHDYITNSYHVNVREPIDPFTKLQFESEFQLLSPGGAISYIECADMTKNIDAVMAVIQFIYDNIMYAELNTKSDYCQVCGYDGEIKIVTDNGRLEWECPNCGNRDKTKMNVTRRTCGYLGSQFWNQGRTEEIRDRFIHLGGDFRG